MTVGLGGGRDKRDRDEEEPQTQRLYRDHDFVPFPQRLAFAEVRMVYCTRCGATQIVESTGAPRDPLPTCPMFVVPA